MKKICFVTTVSLTIRAFMLPIIRYLQSNTDWELSVICDDDPLLQDILPEGVRYFPVSMKRGISLNGVGAVKKMTSIFKNEKFDLVQYSTPNAALYAAIASRLAGIEHRKYHLMGFRFLGFSGWKKRLFKTIEKFTCALSTDIECVSASNLELGVEACIFPKKKASVLFYGSTSGVDLERFDIEKKQIWREELRKEYGYNNQNCVFGFAGRITKDKGINELIAAFKQMDQAHYKLFLVGEFEDDSYLDNEIMEWAKNSENVIFHDFVNDIERYFAMIDVLVLPSYREGFGNIVIEAQAMGVPVIVTDIPGPTDAIIAERTGLIVPTRDVTALKKAMEAMACASELRTTMGLNGRLFAEERFDQRKLCKAILENRKRLLGQ